MTTERYLLFRLGTLHLALEARTLEQVIVLEHYTPLPRSPHSLLGLISAGGSIMPLLNLGAWLKQRDVAYNWAALLRFGNIQWAIALSEVEGLHMAEPPENPAQAGWILGEIDAPGGRVQVINPQLFEKLQLHAL